MALILCPECKKEISDNAINCPHCGYVIKPARKFNPAIAALLSFILPGAGQIYQGKIFAGLLWFTFTIGAYLLFIFLGIILHIICILNAAMANPHPK